MILAVVTVLGANQPANATLTGPIGSNGYSQDQIILVHGGGHHGGGHRGGGHHGGGHHGHHGHHWHHGGWGHYGRGGWGWGGYGNPCFWNGFRTVCPIP